MNLRAYLKNRAAAVTFVLLTLLTVLSLVLRQDSPYLMTQIQIVVLVVVFMLIVILRNKDSISWMRLLRLVVLAAPLIGIHYLLLSFPFHPTYGFSLADFVGTPLISIHDAADSLPVFYTYLRGKYLVEPAIAGQGQFAWSAPVWRDGALIPGLAASLELSTTDYDPYLTEEEKQALLQLDHAAAQTQTLDGAWSYVFIMPPETFSTYWVMSDRTRFFFVPDTRLPIRLSGE